MQENHFYSFAAEPVKSPMNQAQGLRRKHRVCAAAVALFVVSSTIGVGYKMTATGVFALGLPEFCVVVQAAIVSWIFYAAMHFMFLNERGYDLKEGTYSDVSWLDAESGNVVLLEQDSLTHIKFEPTQLDTVQDRYWADSSCASLLQNEADFDVSRTRWSMVTAVLSRSSEATIDIETSYGVSSLSFINVDTKEHALKYITARLPDSALVVQKEQSNALPVIALMAGLLTLIAGALLVGNVLFTTVVGGVASLFFPTFLEVLYKPNIETVIRVSNAYGHDYESNIPPSTSSVVPVTKSF